MFAATPPDLWPWHSTPSRGSHERREVGSDDLPEFYRCIRENRHVGSILRNTPIIDKPATFAAAAAELYCHALCETKSAAFKSIENDIEVIGCDCAELPPQIVGKIMDEALARVKVEGTTPPSFTQSRGEEPPPVKSLDEFNQSISTPESTGRAIVAFPLCAFENIRLDTEHRRYLVKGLLSSTGLPVDQDPPKCGKAWATDVGLHIPLAGNTAAARCNRHPLSTLRLRVATASRRIECVSGSAASRPRRSTCSRPAGSCRQGR